MLDYRLGPRHVTRKALEATVVKQGIPPIRFGVAFLRIRLPCSDPTRDDLNSGVEFAAGTYSLESCMNAVSF